MKVNLKKGLSFVLAMLFLLTLLPVTAFAAALEENYATATDMGGWYASKQPDHALLEKVSDGVQLRQTKQTYYTSSNGKNSTADGMIRKDVYSNVLADTSKGLEISRKSATGNVTITMKYIIDQGAENDQSSTVTTGNGGAFYTLNVDGYITMRLKNSNVTPLNHSSAGSSTISGAISTTKGAGVEKTLVVKIDTVADTVAVSLDGSAEKSCISMNANTGKAAKGYVDLITLTNMQRMNVGGYVKFTSIKVETSDDISQTLDADTVSKLEGFKNINVADVNNVRSNVTLPTHIAGLAWTTSNGAVMSKAGKITRSSDSDPTEVVLSTSFEGKTKSGEAVTFSVKYKFNVTTTSDAFVNTTIINPVEGATSTTEKYYTPPTRGNEEDGYPMPGDPNYISDADFFGVWDASTNTWKSQPYFRYSDYSGLSKVEAAAKAGDYATAESELLAYYKSTASKKVNQITDMVDWTKKYTSIIYDLLSRNAYATHFISSFAIGTFNVPKDWGTVKIDVTDYINEAKGSSNVFTAVLASVDKYRNQAEVYSGESSNPPVLKVKSGWTTKTYNLAKDATLQAGQYANTNYGNETVLYAEEAGDWGDFEDRTKRIYLGFDISSMTSSTSVSEAYIEIKARHTGTDANKLMVAYWIGDGGWDESTVCWNTFPDTMYFSCNDMYCWDYVTSNSTSVKGKVCGYHRDAEPGMLADAYSYYKTKGGETYYEKYAYTYLRQYMGLINSIGLAPDVMNQLDMSTHISSVADDVLRLVDSKYMTPEIFTAYLKHLWMLTDYHADYYYGKTNNNWATFSTEAVYAMYAKFPEFSSHDSWKAKTEAEYKRVLDGLVFEDGMCVELSQNYHVTILNTLTGPYSTYSKTKEPLPFDSNTKELIRNIVHSMLYQSGPYFGGFNIGDGYDTYDSDTQYIYDTWYSICFKDDPSITYMATDGASGSMPENPTTHYKAGLRTYMRSDWSQNALAMSVTNKMVGSHGHKDALSITMFAYGKYLLTDQGYGGVQTGNSWYYMKSPQQHNVVTINDSVNYLSNGSISADVVNNSYKTMDDVDGEELCFDTTSLYDFVEYSTPAYKQAENAQRSVMFLKDQKFWIVTDYIVPKDATKTNEFAQNWHLYPGAAMTIDSSTKTIKSNFSNQANVMLVPVDAASINKTEIRGTRYSEENGQITDSQKAMLYKNKTGNAVFSTVIIPRAKGENFNVTTTKLSTGIDENEVNAFSFTVKNTSTSAQSNYYYYHVNDATKQKTVNVGSYSTDANTLLVQEDTSGNIVSIYMINGSFVKKNSTDIIKTSNSQKSTLAFTVANKAMNIETTEGKESVLKNLQFASSLATSVKFMDKAVDFSVANGMITFTNAVDDGLHTNPSAGTLVYDSSVNPELLSYVVHKQSGYFDVVNNLAKGGGLRFEQKLSDSADRTSLQVGFVRFPRIISTDAANSTVTATDLVSGKYAIEMELQHKITTQNVTAEGKKNETYSTLVFGLVKSDDDGKLLTGGLSTASEYRLYNYQLNAIRYADTQADGQRHDVNKLANQVLASDTPWKLRIAIDTVANTYTIFINDVQATGAVNYPFNLSTNYGYLPDFRFNLMKANDVGSYIQINNVKIYEIEQDVNDSRMTALNNIIGTLPLKLTDSPLNVTGNITVPSVTNVKWETSDSSLMSNAGVLLKDVKVATPVSLSTLFVTSDTNTARKFTLKKYFNMTVVPAVVTIEGWYITATKSGKTVTVNALEGDSDYSAKPVLVIAGYDANGRMCDFETVTVTSKLEDYTQTLSDDAITAKVFLLNNLAASVPMIKNLILNN
ncbi:MAG: heparinase II/III family protein [Clostridia bacterium]|nr:heparinase II/III family protein [Clostridia bacterium]